MVNSREHEPRWKHVASAAAARAPQGSAPKGKQLDLVVDIKLIGQGTPASAICGCQESSSCIYNHAIKKDDATMWVTEGRHSRQF